MVTPCRFVPFSVNPSDSPVQFTEKVYFATGNVWSVFLFECKAPGLYPDVQTPYWLVVG